MDSLYYNGDIIIHHRNNTHRFFSLPEKLLDQKLLQSVALIDEEYFQFRVLRRIQGNGLLWNKASDAFLGIENFKAAKRNKVFQELINKDMISALQIEDIDTPLYISKKDIELLKYVINNEFIPRFEFIAPLDHLMWDRKLIKEIFDFEYKWEIYTPKSNREYGYYVLPLLYGYDFIGRIEIKVNRRDKELIVENIWYQENKTVDRNILMNHLDKFRVFHSCEYVTILCNI